MKVLITGYPGTGKSTIAKVLKARGRHSYDTEAMCNYMHAVNVHSGKRIAIPSPVPRGWFDTTGSYNWDIPRVTALLNSYEEIYICALADNQEEFYPLFDKIFILLLDEVELENRLLSRPTTPYGKDRDELADIMLLHKHFEQSLIESGAVPIDVHPSINEIVDTILRLINDD